MKDELIVYHGTNVLFDKVDLKHSKDKRDFGKGFYTTTLEEYAANWAENMYIRYGGDGKIVMKFKLTLAKDLYIRRFTGMNKEWLTMIKNNRMYGNTQHGYDIVIGPVADDNTIRTLSLYVAGIYDEEMAIKLLKSYVAHDQVSLHTERALKCLEFLGRTKS
ncbi:MAG: DUF3990 domain-containing protein [Lachnoclostridium sp.]|jgi:adenine specific DNA methylase Mod